MRSLLKFLVMGWCFFFLTIFVFYKVIKPHLLNTFLLLNSPGLKTGLSFLRENEKIFFHRSPFKTHSAYNDPSLAVPYSSQNLKPCKGILAKHILWLSNEDYVNATHAFILFGRIPSLKKLSSSSLLLLNWPSRPQENTI